MKEKMLKTLLRIAFVLCGYALIGIVGGIEGGTIDLLTGGLVGVGLLIIGTVCGCIAGSEENEKEKK